MTPDKRRRAASAILFLFGVLACLRAVLDAPVLWPLDQLWHALNPPHRLQLVGGVAVIVVAFIVTMSRGRQ